MLVLEKDEKDKWLPKLFPIYFNKKKDAEVALRVVDLKGLRRWVVDETQSYIIVSEKELKNLKN
jgi:hypothetical protein